MDETKDYIYTFNNIFDDVDYLFNNKHDGLLKIKTDNKPTVYEKHTEYKIFYNVKYKTYSTQLYKQSGYIIVI